MLNKFFTAFVLITATTSAVAFPGPSGSFNQSGAHGGNIQGTRTTTTNSGQFEGSVTGAKGNGVSAETSAQKKGNKTSYTGTATTTGGKSATATGTVHKAKQVYLALMKRQQPQGIRQNPVMKSIKTVKQVKFQVQQRQRQVQVIAQQSQAVVHKQVVL